MKLKIQQYFFLIERNMQMEQVINNLPKFLRSSKLEPIMVKIDRKHSTDSGFWTVTFNDVTLVITPDGDMFNANNLLLQICQRKRANGSCSASFKDFIAGETGYFMLQNEPELFMMKKDVGYKSRPISGNYLSWELLDTFLAFCDKAGKGLRWRMNRSDWRDTGKEGHLYLVQDEDDVGSTTFKVGRCWSTERRMKGYGKGREELRHAEVADQHEAEKILIRYFVERFDHALDDKGRQIGDEYFICESKEVAIRAFDKAIKVIEKHFEDN